MDFESILRTIQPFLVLFIALFAAFLTATWVSAVIWSFRDIRSRTRDIFAQILATLMVLIFFPLFPIPGLILYLLLRPRETLSEIYERTLEEEALLQGIEERLACPGCNRSIEEDFVVCPTCHTRLKKPCIVCGRRLHLRWSICAYCGASQSQTVPAPPEAIILPPQAPVGAPQIGQPVTQPPAELAAASQTESAGLEFEPGDDFEFGTEPLPADAEIEPADQAEQPMDVAWQTGTGAEPYSDSDQGEEQPPPVEQEAGVTAGDEPEVGQVPEPEPDKEAWLSWEPEADPSAAGEPDLESDPLPDLDTQLTGEPESGEEPPPAAEHDDLEEESEPGSESPAEEEADSEQDGESAQPELL